MYIACCIVSFYYIDLVGSVNFLIFTTLLPVCGKNKRVIWFSVSFSDSAGKCTEKLLKVNHIITFYSFTDFL